MKQRQFSNYLRSTLLLTCLLGAAKVPAREPKDGAVSGHVMDAVGATIAGASIYVRRNIPGEDSVRLLMHTDMYGDFKLLLPEGGYDVLVTSPGLAAQVQTVPVMAGKIRRTHWKLKALNCDFPGMNCDPVR